MASPNRFRIRYTKVGRVRFVSARDMTAVWERALRRADLPIAYSEGFHPHAKVSFPDALGVGLESSGEYAELTFAEPIDPGPAFTALSATLPQGMDITTYLHVPDGAPKLARMLPATLWRLTWDAGSPALTDLLAELARTLLEATTAEVVKRKPSGDKVIDVRPAVVDLHVDGHESTTILSAVLRNDGPTVRPLDLLAAFGHLGDAPDGGAPSLPEPSRVVRVAQGEAVDGGLTEGLTGEHEPLAPGRLAGAA